MNPLSVVIPSRNAVNLAACVKAIRDCGETCEIVVVDDGLERRVPDCRYIDGIKPFVFSRNMNLGIVAAGDDDVLLLNDDAILLTPGGFTELQRQADEHREFGLIAATTNNVGNTNQFQRGIGLREDPRMVCFIAVLIPRRTIDLVGMLDEDYVCYSHQDDDYCYRVRKAGLKIGICDGCFVDHRSLPSTFRGLGGPGGDLVAGAEIFRRKHGGNPMAL